MSSYMFHVFFLTTLQIGAPSCYLPRGLTHNIRRVRQKMKRPNAFHLISKMYNMQASTVSVFQGKYFASIITHTSNFSNLTFTFQIKI
jgi:hypothetical protein